MVKWPFRSIEKPSYKDLLNLSNQLKFKVSKLNLSLDKCESKYKDNINNYILETVKKYDSQLSYIIIDENMKIFASTKEFLEKFNYGPIEGTKVSYVLKTPNPQVKVLDWIVLQEFINDNEPDSLETTIVDGKGKNRLVYIEKYAPDKFTIYVPGEEKVNDNSKKEDSNVPSKKEDSNNPSEKEDSDIRKIKEVSFSYRRFAVHEVGYIFNRKGVDGKKYHKNKQRDPKKIQEYIEGNKISEIAAGNEELEKVINYIPKLFKYKIKGEEALLVWYRIGRKRNFGNFRNECARLIREKRKKSRKK